jgi:uncharacterized membrane protein
MMRPLLWLLAGLVLGGIIHIVVMLTLPLLAQETTWTRVAALNAKNEMIVLPQVKVGEANPLGLDPLLVYGLCEIDLATAPAYLTGRLPDAHWSVAIFNQAGSIIYSTTNRDGIGQTLDLGIFNAAQTRLLAQQQIDVAEGVLVVEAPTDRLFALVRLAPPHVAMRPRFEQAMDAITCQNRL